MFINILRKIGIDSHVGNTIILRLWNIVVGMLLMLLIPLKLSSREQGYYYTIMSLVSIQIFFELGLNYVITQLTAHESARMEENILSKIKVAKILSLSNKWYSLSSFLFFCVAVLVGFFLLKIDSNNISIMVTWLAIVLFTSINLFLSPKLAIMEGLGKVDEVAKLRLKQSFFGYIALAILLLLNIGLPAMICISLFSSLIAIKWCLTNEVLKMFTSKDLLRSESESILWRRDILPFQWRIAVSWISGYFIFQILTPVIFYHQGAEGAGKLGLSLSVFNTILTLSMSWVYAKAPTFGSLISIGNFSESKKLFKLSIINSSVCNFVLAMLFILFVFLLDIFYPELASRILPIHDLFILMVCSVINQVVFSGAIYMRAFKEEPMMVASVVSGIFVFIGFYFFSKIGITSALLAYAVVTLFISFPWMLILLKKYYSINNRT